MKLDFVISLEKCVALFSYRSSSSVENIVNFYFVRDLDIGLHYLPSPINTHPNIRTEQILKHHMFFISDQLKISCIFSS